MRNVRLNDGTSAFLHQFPEFPSPYQTLTGGYRKRQSARDFDQSIDMLGPAGFFIPVGIVVDY
jgi:hypothetical protein